MIYLLHDENVEKIIYFIFNLNISTNGVDLDF